eukprot:scaffold22356_cov53-Attheya_sp.AAC.5
MQSKEKKQTPKMRIVVPSRKRKRKLQVVSTAASSAAKGSLPRILTAPPRQILSSSDRLEKKVPVQSDQEPENLDASYWNESHDGDEEAFSLPCDTLLAIRSLVANDCCVHCPLLDHYDHDSPVLFVLKHMIPYTLHSSASKNATLMNRKLSAAAYTDTAMELAELSRNNQIRQLHLQLSGHDESNICIMETHHYIQAIWNATTSYSKTEAMMEVVNDIVTKFVASLSEWTGTYITTEELEEIFHSRRKPSTHDTDVGNEKPVELLVSMGLLMPRQRLAQTGSSSSFLFSLPGLGKASTWIEEGRTVVCRRIQRANYKEFKRSTMEVGRLCNGALSCAFCIRDLLALGRLRLTQTPSGEFIRLPLTK